MTTPTGLFWAAVAFAAGLNIAVWFIAASAVLRFVRELRSKPGSSLPKRPERKRPWPTDEVVRVQAAQIPDAEHEFLRETDDAAWLASLPASERCESTDRSWVRAFLARSPRIRAVLRGLLTTNTTTPKD